MMSLIEQAFEYAIGIRLYDDRAAPDGVVVLAEDVVRMPAGPLGQWEGTHSARIRAVGRRYDSSTLASSQSVAFRSGTLKES
ncbi:hypothetical protein ACFKHW_08150 [Bradyrhizobium lupini]|jgi:hypothetical protein|uniref:hypothetical protein n=1 Tax=Rhizobium lupini TaxID=136996 RepID=UPI00366C8968